MEMKHDPNDKIHGLKDTSIGDYWKWAYSDILSNRNRGIFAEFLVGNALDAIAKPRVEYNCVDICYKNKTIEVKCSAYVQSWPQDKKSRIEYGIGKKKVDVGSEYIPKEYLFSWEEIPGNDKERFIEFLRMNFSIKWVKGADIKKNDDGKIISVTSEKNSLSLTHDEKTRVNLKIDDGRTFKFIVKVENGREYIYLPGRFADCYVFCLFDDKENDLEDKEKANKNILDIKFWEFYVVPTSEINMKFDEKEKISLSDVKKDVKKYSEAYGYDELKKRIDTVLFPAPGCSD
jgi:hypothetical protein